MFQTDQNYNPLKEEIKNKVYKLYLANIQNRLRELDNPKDVDCKRWPWELIQNAKDSIAGLEDRTTVEIEILVEGDKYTFRHNGAPFTLGTLSGLLCKFSEGKSNNSESTGRFGTGFLTTHTLSKIVNITGGIILNDSEPQGFKVTMFREGKDDELLKGIEKTVDSYKSLDEYNEWTSFEYLAKTEDNKKSGRLGIQNFKENIAQVMLFCAVISRITLNDNGKILRIERDVEDNSKECKILTLKEEYENGYLTKTFLYVENEKKNEQNCRICCAIELDENNNIVNNNLSPYLYCTLPFVGSEKHILPFLINSPDFEPDSERQSIVLNGKEFEENTGEISNPGINKMILKESQKLYEILLNYVCEHDIKNRYLLAKGLNTLSNDIQYFDSLWYEENFTKPMRDILIQYPITQNNNQQFVKLTDIYLPLVGKYKNINIQKQAYKFIADIYAHQVPTFDESIQLDYYIWKNDNKRIKYITMEKCVKRVSSFKNLNTFKENFNEIENIWTWMNEFLEFINKYHPSFINTYSIIPNMNKDFVSLSEFPELTTSKYVPENMIECLEELGNPWKSDHIHKNITSFSHNSDHDMEFAGSKIRSYLNEWSDKVLTFISYIPYDNEDEKFVQKRNTVYELCSTVWHDKITSKKDGTSFPKELWNGVDDIIFENLLEKIQNYGCLGGIYTIEYMKKCLECTSEYYPKYKYYSIVPNQNEKFCQPGILYEDDNIPNLFKECMKNCFNHDIKEELIDKRLTYITTLVNDRKKNTYDYNTVLNDYFKSDVIYSEKKKLASEYLIKIIPKEIINQEDDYQNCQRKFFDIYKILTRKKAESIEIDRNENNYDIWKCSNEYIYNDIKNVIEKYNNVSLLAKALNINKSEIYEYLNIIIKVFSKGKILEKKLEGKIFPNQNEEFCKLKDLFNEGFINPSINDNDNNNEDHNKSNKIELIPENLKNRAKELGYDVRAVLLHSSIGRLPVIDIMSKKDVNAKLDEILENINEDPTKQSDIKYKKAVSSLMGDYFESIRNNPFDNDKTMVFFRKSYVTNVYTRLRDLENPIDEDCKRWPWELIQNAKDSISGQKDRTGVDIEIWVEGNKYIFKHNGAPFNDDMLPALLYKFSEGKSKNTESTGRFGTGFLTTHTLSKVVKIKSEFVSNDQEEPQGFTITMFREGDKKELLEGIKKTEKSYKSPVESDGWTSYEYIAKTDINKKAGKLGIQNFKENIANVMLFCPDIHTILLNDERENFKVERIYIEDNGEKEKCQKIIIEGMSDNNKLVFKKTYVFVKYEEFNELLSKKFDKTRDLRIYCAIELNEEDHSIINDTISPCLYCSLPLVGSEKHVLPFLINSPDFEPDSERQCILLNGKEFYDNGEITERGINRMILKNSQKIYKILLDYVCEHDIKNRYLLAKGLDTLSNDIQFFDSLWYEENFTKPMRDILIQYPIVLNYDQQFVKLTDIYLPLVGEYEDIDIQKKAYKFIADVYNYQVPTFNNSIQLENYIWKMDDRIKYISMEKCIEHISSFKNLKTFEENCNKIENIWTWMNEFLEFINKYHPSFINTYSIIPNMNKDFVSLSEFPELTTSKYIPENMIECLEELGNPWKSDHIHKNITSFSHNSDHDMEFAGSKIRSYLYKWSDKILTFISYIPYDNENENFIQKRNTVYELCSTVWHDKITNKKDGTSFPKELWNGVDDIIFENLLEKIQNYGCLGGIYTIDYMKKCLECVSEYFPYYRNYSVVPNQNEKFCQPGILYEDDNIPNLFKECMKNCFNHDIKEELIDKRLTYITTLVNDRKKNIYDYNTVLNIYFQSDVIYSEKKKLASEYLIKIIPKEIENDENDYHNIQRKIFNMYKIFNKVNCTCYEIERNNNSNSNFNSLWYYSNNYIFEKIVSIIGSYNNVESLAKVFNMEKEDVFKYLNILIISFSPVGKIIPDQNEKLNYKYNLYNEGEIDINTNEKKLIPVELKNISKKLGYDVRQYLIHENIIGLNNNERLSYFSVCKNIDKLMIEKHKVKSKHSDPEFQSAIHELIEVYFETIGDEKAKHYFPETYSEKDSIVLNELYDKETRNAFTKFGKTFGKENINKLFENKELVIMIINGTLTKNNLNNNVVNITNYNNYTTINNNFRSVSLAFNISMKSNERKYYENTFKNVFEFCNDLDFSIGKDDELSFNRMIGYYGEFFIYEELCKSNMFKSVTLMCLSENERGIKLEYRGKTYYVIQDGSHYDIEVETMDNRKIYIEIKSTRREFGNKIPFFLSPKQIEMMKNIVYPNEYFLAVVFDVEHNPKYFFMKLTDNIMNNFITYNPKNLLN